MKNLFKVTLLALLTLSCTEPILGQKLKVIAYNVEYGRNTSPEAMAKLLRSEKADIICFNEVPVEGWTKKVGKILRLKYSYEGKIASANHTTNFKDETGNYYGKFKSILSKFPLENTHEISLEGVGWSPSTAVAAKVIIDKKNSIQIFSLHIPSGKSDPSNSNAESLSKIIKSKYTIDKVIIAGDFNDLHDSEPLSYLYNIGFSNSWKALNVDMKNKTTYPKRPNTVIDHIFFRGLKIIGAEIIEEQGITQSDHKPIWSLFELK